MVARSLPATNWRPLRWTLYGALTIAVFAVGLWNLVALRDLAAWFPGHHGFDWQVLTEAARLDNPYDQPWYVWSPVAVYAIRLIEPIGEVGLWAVHFLALIPLGWVWGGVALASFPFWFDLYLGNVLTVVAVMGFLAIRGNRTAMIGFAILALLMPRPLMLPLIAWLLWREPWTRVPFAALCAVNLVAVGLTGLGPAWIERVMHLPASADQVNLAFWPWPVGLALAGVAFRFGWIGIASVLAQPYVWPHYLLLLILDARRVPSSR